MPRPSVGVGVYLYKMKFKEMKSNILMILRADWSFKNLD